MGLTLCRHSTNEALRKVSPLSSRQLEARLRRNDCLQAKFGQVFQILTFIVVSGTHSRFCPLSGPICQTSAPVSVFDRVDRAPACLSSAMS